MLLRSTDSHKLHFQCVREKEMRRERSPAEKQSKVKAKLCPGCALRMPSAVRASSSLPLRVSAISLYTTENTHCPRTTQLQLSCPLHGQFLPAESSE